MTSESIYGTLSADREAGSWLSPPTGPYLLSSRTAEEMRPGLVAVGTVFLVLGGVAVGAWLSEPSPTTKTEASTVQWGWTVPAQSSFETPLLWGLNGSFQISWSSSAVLAAKLFSESCPGYAPCVKGGVENVYSWPNGSRGTWSAPGTPGYPYYVMFTSSVPAAASVAASTQSTSSSPLPPSDTLAMIAGTLAGITLVGLGGIALFLGLFLRRNVFGRPPPLVSQRAEDAAAIAEQTDPQRPDR
jgi:hypothetical protein